MAKSADAFRTISEVAEWLDTPAHVLRFWESKFSQVKPVKRAGGRRYYRPQDMLLLGGIKKLLHDDGMTIKGVQKLLREQGVKHVASLSPKGTDDQGPMPVPSPREPESEAGQVVDFPGGAVAEATEAEEAGEEVAEPPASSIPKFLGGDGMGDTRPPEGEKGAEEAAAPSPASEPGAEDMPGSGKPPETPEPPDEPEPPQAEATPADDIPDATDAEETPQEGVKPEQQDTAPEDSPAQAEEATDAAPEQGEIWSLTGGETPEDAPVQEAQEAAPEDMGASEDAVEETSEEAVEEVAEEAAAPVPEADDPAPVPAPGRESAPEEAAEAQPDTEPTAAPAVSLPADLVEDPGDDMHAAPGPLTALSALPRPLRRKQAKALAPFIERLQAQLDKSA